jgi:hypothetical protein
MSFREKSAWASLAVMLLVFVPYFIRMFRLFRWRELTAGSALGQFIGAVIFQVVLLVIVHIVIALRSRQESKDERDRAIESKAFRNAYFVLVSSGFVVIPCVIGLEFGIDPSSLHRLLAPAFISQLLLLCFVVAEAAKYLTQIVSYRRGS